MLSERFEIILKGKENVPDIRFYGRSGRAKWNAGEKCEPYNLHTHHVPHETKLLLFVSNIKTDWLKVLRIDKLR